MKRMICTIMGFVVFCTMLSTGALAVGGESGLFTYEIKGNGTAVITKFDWHNNNGEDVYVPNMIDGYTVTEIGKYAFSLENVLGIQLENEGTTHENATWYNYGDNVVVVLPQTITVIGEKAFFCTNITAINIPASVQLIGEGAFAGCRPAKGYNVEPGNQIYTTIKGCLYNKQKKELVAYCLNDEMKTADDCKIPEGIVSIGAYAAYCEKTGAPDSDLVGLELPSTVKNIGDYAFALTGGIKDPLPDTVENIGDYAFQYAWVQSIHWPQSLKHIGYSAFEGAHVYDDPNEYERIYLPPNVEEIGERVFCKADIGNFFGLYDSINLSNTRIEKIPAQAFMGVNTRGILLPDQCKEIGKEAFAKAGIDSITIPKTIKRIGESAFSESSGEISFSNEADNLVIEKNAFMGFEFSNDTLELPEGSVEIQDNAFADVIGLTTLVIPESVTSIGTKICDRASIKLEVKPESYAAIWASENGYQYSTGEEDTSWLNE